MDYFSYCDLNSLDKETLQKWNVHLNTYGNIADVSQISETFHDNKGVFYAHSGDQVADDLIYKSYVFRNASYGMVNLDSCSNDTKKVFLELENMIINFCKDKTMKSFTREFFKNNPNVEIDFD